MSAAQKRCQLLDCTRAASTLCFCCSRNVCTRHFSEHIEAVRAQIDPLANEVNTMVENIGSLSLEKLKETSLVKLRRWQIDMRRLVDQVFEEKSLEIEKFCRTNEEMFRECQSEHMSTVMTMQDEIRQLAEDGDATVEQIKSLKTRLQNLENDVGDFEKGFLVVDVTALAQGLVHISSNTKKPPSNPAGSVPAGPTSARERRKQNVEPPVTPQAQNPPKSSDKKPPSFPFGSPETPTTKSSNLFGGFGAFDGRPTNASPSAFSFGTQGPTPAAAPNFPSFGSTPTTTTTSGFDFASTTPTSSIFGTAPTTSTSASSTPIGGGLFGFGSTFRKN